MAKRVLEMINNIKMCANRGVSTLKIYQNRSFLLPLLRILSYCRIKIFLEKNEDNQNEIYTWLYGERVILGIGETCVS